MACFLAGKGLGGNQESERFACCSTHKQEMKKAFLLSAVLGALLTMGGCANQNHPTAHTSSQHGLVGPGSVAPISGGPTRPGPVPQRFKP